MNVSNIPYRGKRPRAHDSAFIAPGAVLAGDIEIGAESSVWFGCIIRGDVNNVRIGARTNVQDGAVIHVSSFGYGAALGDDVTVGHMAMLHACTVEDGAFIGMKACVMDGAVVEKGAMVAAGALVTAGKCVPSGELWAGTPAKFLREMTEKEKEYLRWSAQHYVKLSREYKGACEDDEQG
ncbi:MAG: gamma carbonic anhydrase family protein [Alphaproteobacteria bacterium]|nr:gamma carbonic anhydrase family protein [Alphaproteobacteria bacterium]